MNRIVLLLVAAIAVACSDASVADEHPPVIASNTGEHPPTDTSGIAVHNARAKVRAADGAASTEQAALPTNCDKPPHLFKTLTNVAITSAQPTATCPAVWSANDVQSWWIGYGTDPSRAPVTTFGTCQWTESTWPTGTDRCTLTQRFACPNAVTYLAQIRASGSSAFPWGATQATMTAWHVSNTCKRTAKAAF